MLVSAGGKWDLGSSCEHHTHVRDSVESAALSVTPLRLKSTAWNMCYRAQVLAEKALILPDLTRTQHPCISEQSSLIW